MGPLAGGGTRALALANTEQFLRKASLARGEGASRNAALSHILNVEQRRPAGGSQSALRCRCSIPLFRNAVGNAFKTAAQVIANKAGVAVVKSR